MEERVTSEFFKMFYKRDSKNNNKTMELVEAWKGGGGVGEKYTLNFIFKKLEEY